MLKLYIYGYLNRVQSSRRLEREAGRNLEVMWLTGRLAPDHKTIADFRKDNGPAIKKVCAQFVELCRKMGLLAKASIAIDGSKFKAVNSRDNNFTQGKIQRRQKQIEESVARYMSQLDTADRQTVAGEEPSETVLLTKARLREKLVKLQEEVKRLAGIEKTLLASPDKSASSHCWRPCEREARAAGSMTTPTTALPGGDAELRFYTAWAISGRMQRSIERALFEVPPAVRRHRPNFLVEVPARKLRPASKGLKPVRRAPRTLARRGNRVGWPQQVRTAPC